MSIIVFLVVLCFLGAIVRVPWGAFKFLFVLVALVALLHSCDHRREIAGAVPASRYGVAQ